MKTLYVIYKGHLDLALRSLRPYSKVSFVRYCDFPTKYAGDWLAGWQVNKKANWTKRPPPPLPTVSIAQDCHNIT